MNESAIHFEKILSFGDRAHFNRLLRTEPMVAMDALRNTYRNAETTFLKEKHFCLSGGYQFALLASRDPKLMKAFYSLEFFHGGHQPKAGRILRNAMCYVVGARRGPRYPRAAVYAKALQGLFERAAPVSEVCSLLDKLGIEFLYKAALARARTEPEAIIDNPSESPDSADLSGQAEKQTMAMKTALDASTFSDEMRPELLYVRVSQKILSRIFELDNEQGGVLRIKRKTNDSDFVQIIGRGFTPDES